MTEAAQPVISDHELFRPLGAVPGPGPRETQILPATVTTPLDGNDIDVAQIANPSQSEKENEKANEIIGIHQTASESEKIT